MFLRSRVGVFVKISFFCHLLTITVAEKGCKELCSEKWDVKVAYENCLRQCSQKFSTEIAITSQKIKTYPKPPQNIRVDLSIRILRYTKYITAKVNWDSDKDEKRDGYYLSFLSKSSICETKFPGFHTLNIPSDANYFDIPNQTPSFQPLVLDFGCIYQLEMRSKPYPYGDPAFTSIAVVDIPNCVDGYCTCRSQQKLQDPKNLNIMTIDDGSGNNTKVQVSWQFSFQNDHFGKDTIEFRVKLAELLRKANVAPWKKIFRWTQWEEAIVAEKNKEKYSANLPMLIDGNEYKVQVFAFNQHFCRSHEIEKEFIASTDYKSTITFDIFSTLAPAGTTATSISSNNSTDTSGEVTTVTSLTTTAAVSTTVNSTKDLPVVTHALTIASSKDEYLMVFLPIIGVLCLIISMFAVWKFYSSHKEKLLKNKQYLSQMHENPWTLIASGPSTLETNILYTEKEITEARAHGFADAFEISYERISLGRVIGQGAFGLVYMGQAESIRGVSGPTQVAIKQLKANADDRERKEFLSEIEMMKMITPHPNIVTMYGCCTLMYPHCMIMDYVPYGDLLKYLRNLRKEFEQKMEEYRDSLERDYIMQLATHPMMTRAEINTSSAKRVQTSRQRDLSAYDIMSASSNSHHSCQCGHCDNICDPIPFVDDSDLNISNNMDDYASLSLDVAELQSFALQVACGMAHLENLQITHRDLACRNILVGHGKILKISDFGLSRTGIYVKTTSGRIPLRWLSLEAMRDHAYSTKSDVWAYGVVLWEICTLGGFPYPTMADKEILKYLESGNRLDKPGSCSDNIYKLMMQCWSSNPSQRPSFCNIKRTLKEMDNDGHAYVEFSAQDDMSLPPQDYCRIVPLATLDEIRMGPNV